MNTRAAPVDFVLQPTLVGPTLALRPLCAEDFESLYAAASDPLIWAQHPEPQRFQREFFANGFFASAIASGSAFVVIDRRTDNIIGSSRYYDWHPHSRDIAIGYTFLARSHWGGSSNAEMKQLMLDHAFRWAERVWFHVGSNNWRSRKAVEKLGGQFDHEEVVSTGSDSTTRIWYFLDRPSTR